uniref:Palmitoyltransferase n=1 Tax=Cacopsylla melanoneura TaxID=428564 RepID=A0A8D8RGW3_9HEMI
MATSRNSSPCCSEFCVLPCIKCIKWIPVLFISCIIVWSYYAYVYVLCLSTIDNIIEKSFMLVFYHIILVLFVWSYYQTIMTPLGIVPKHFKLTPSLQHALFTTDNEIERKQILEQFSASLPVLNKSIDGSARFCDKCYQIKSDRSHHCSVCGKCVLKMDHHCPWVNNCVSFTNYKYFVLFLGYALLYCIYCALSSLPSFLQYWEGSLMHSIKFHILFLCFVSAMFSLSLVALFGYHLYLVAQNKTTLEAIRAPIFSYGPDKRGFHLGVRRNFVEIFGENKWLWLLPVQTYLGDGIRFPVRGSNSNQYNSMGNTGSRPDSKLSHNASNMQLV